MPKEYDFTQEWQEKTIGENYNNTLDYYNKTDLCWRMYNDNQWYGIPAKDLSKFQANVCKQGPDYIIASIMSRPLKAEYNADNIPEPLPDDMSLEATANKAIRGKITTLNKWSEIKWEKEKMDSKLRKLLLDAACSGDMVCHVYWDSKVKTGQAEQGDFCVELVDGANIMFGDPNIHEVEKQPYILVIGRATVKKLKKRS